MGLSLTECTVFLVAVTSHVVSDLVDTTCVTDSQPKPRTGQGLLQHELRVNALGSQRGNSHANAAKDVRLKTHLSDKANGIKLQQPVGIRMLHGSFRIIFPVGTTLPAESTEVFTTGVKDQDTVSFHLFQGDPANKESSIDMGNYVLNGLLNPNQQAHESRIDTQFKIDELGMLTVHVVDLLGTATKAGASQKVVYPTDKMATIVRTAGTILPEDVYKSHGLFGKGWKARKIIFRPLWQKSLRCTGTTGDTCEECSPDSKTWSGKVENCWYDQKVVERGNDEMDEEADDEAEGGMLYRAEDEKGKLEPIKGSWTSVRSVRRLLVRGDKFNNDRFKRHVSVLHVHCQRSVQVTITFGLLKSGSVTVLWDGVELTPANFPSADIRVFGGFRTPDADVTLPLVESAGISQRTNRRLAVHLPEVAEGGHDLSLEFTPSSDRGGVSVKGISLFMPGEFVQCEDTKVCLGTLSEYGEGGLLLRNTNSLQLRCLTGKTTEPSGDQNTETVRNACAAWLACLSSSETFEEHHKEKLLNMLYASAETEDVEESMNTRAKMLTADQEHCIHPTTADPESWECDCYEDMLTRCNAIAALETSSTGGAGLLEEGDYKESRCIRALFCLHPRTCDSWKTSSCSTPKVVRMMDALDKKESLTQRALALNTQSVGDHVQNAENALNVKSCV